MNSNTGKLLESFPSFPYNQFKIYNIYKNSNREIEESIISFWLENRAVSLEVAKRRVKEVLFIITVKERITGIYTAFLKEFLYPKNFYYFTRIFISQESRGSFGLRMFLHQRAFEFLKSYTLESLSPHGIAIEMENIKYGRDGYQKYLQRSGFTYYGLNPLSQQMWYVNFKDPKGIFDKKRVLERGSFFKTYSDEKDLQKEFDVAVVIPTILRDSLKRTIDSIYRQDLKERVQILIGIDKPIGSLKILDEIFENIPNGYAVSVFYPGHSTSKRHGGVHKAYDGGSLRTVLSFLANSRYVAYLDDDNWWEANHLQSLLNAVQKKEWAFSLRRFIDEKSGENLGEDNFESIGLGKGIYSEKLGGVCDPNTIIIDKVKCEDLLALWCKPMESDKKGMSADRRVFDALRTRSYGETKRVTVNYKFDESDALSKVRKSFIDNDN